MKYSLSSLGPKEPLGSLTGAIKVFQPLAYTAVAWMYCCVRLGLDLRSPSAVFVLRQLLYPALNMVFSVFLVLTAFWQIWHSSRELAVKDQSDGFTICSFHCNNYNVEFFFTNITWNLMVIKFVLRMKSPVHTKIWSLNGKQTVDGILCTVGCCCFTCFNFGFWVLWGALR